MNVTIFTEERYRVDAAGTVSTLNGTAAAPLWARYLDVFDHVVVAARIDVSQTGAMPRQDAGVAFHAVPYYIGPADYVQHLRGVRRAVYAACAADGAFILRAPGRLAATAAHALRSGGIPYGVEVAGDPVDVFARGAVHHPLRPVFRLLFATDLRRVVRHAVAAAYVTDRVLQERYPCGGLQVGVSDVSLDESALCSQPRRPRAGQRTFRIVTVGSLAQLYKGPDILLAAVASCVRSGLDLSVVFVGDGAFRPLLAARAAELGLADRATFRGEVSAGAGVRAELDAADLFVLPSRADGLPRALIEAMARGLPCLASDIGGIPELLVAEDLLPVGDSAGVARRIADVLQSPARMARMADRNLARARDFAAPRLSARRREFMREVERRTRAARAPRALTSGGTGSDRSIAGTAVRSAAALHRGR